MPSLKTRLAVERALSVLSKTKQVEKIKVTDLCHECGIGRSTFYDNFDDIYGVTHWMWDYIMEDSLYQAGVTLGYYEAHVRVRVDASQCQHARVQV